MRLIERSFGTAPLLQPLVSPMFAKGESLRNDNNQFLDLEDEMEYSEQNRGYPPPHDDMTTLEYDHSLSLQHEAEKLTAPLPSGEIANIPSPRKNGKDHAPFPSPETDFSLSSLPDKKRKHHPSHTLPDKLNCSDNFISNRPFHVSHDSGHKETSEDSSLGKATHGPFSGKPRGKKSFENPANDPSSSKSVNSGNTVSLSNLLPPIDHSISIMPVNEKRYVAAPIGQKIIQKQIDETSKKTGIKRYLRKEAEDSSTNIQIQKNVMTEIQRHPFETSHSKKVFQPQASIPNEKRGAIQKSQSSYTQTYTPASNPSTNSQPQPTVRVTIGRIEVHAAMPPVKTPQRASSQGPPSSTQSLADYLKYGSGGQR